MEMASNVFRASRRTHKTRTDLAGWRKTNQPFARLQSLLTKFKDVKRKAKGELLSALNPILEGGFFIL